MKPIDVDILSLSHEEILDLAIPDPDYAELLSIWPKSNLNYTDIPTTLSRLRTLPAPLSDPTTTRTTVHALAVPTTTSQPATTLNTTLYLPAPLPASLPLIILYHGGGLVFGTPAQLTSIAHKLASTLKAAVICPSYRLAPEFPLPVPWDDIWDSFTWCALHARELHAAAQGRVDVGLGLVVGGFSAGATAALGVVHRARDEGFGVRVTGLWMGAGGARLANGQGKVVREVREEFGGKMLSRGQECVQDDPMLNRGLMGLIETCVGLGGDEAWRNGLVWNGSGSGHGKYGHAGLPKVYLQVCGIDPARDETLVLRELMKREGVKTRLELYSGLPHCFWLPLRDIIEDVVEQYERDSVAGVGWLLRAE